MERRNPLTGSSIKENPLFFPIIFLILAVISAFCLDFIAWKKGNTSYVFAAFPTKKKVVVEKETLDKIAHAKLIQQGIAPDSIDQYQDEEGVFHFLIDLPIEQYKTLETPLEQEFKAAKTSVSKKEEDETEEKNFYLWEIKGKKKQKIILLFSCLKERPPTEEAPVIRAKKKVAIIIDDMGYSLGAIREIIEIQKPLTVAILPFSPMAKETAQIAHRNGLEVILHLPLEAVNNDDGNNGIEGLIHSRMNQEEVLSAVDDSLNRVPNISGVNNHMGSKITTDKTFMKTILERLKQRDLFFIDSRTTTESVAYDVAKNVGVPTAYRNIFLDNTIDEKTIKKKLLTLFKLAQKRGQAVAICHPTPQTLKILRENLHLIDEYNLEAVHASQIVK
jgi:polysaccharide deacetylase 2 family uncharacterized protein YibQ